MIRWITEVFHRSPNKNGDTPLELWLSSEAENGRPGASFQKSFIERVLAKVSSGAIQRTGITSHGIVYSSSELSEYRLKLSVPSGRRSPIARFRWSEHDMGKIWVFDELSKCYFEVPAVDESVHGMTRYANDIVNRERKKRREEKWNDESRLETVIQISEDIDRHAKKATKRSRAIQSKGARFKAGVAKVVATNKPPSSIGKNASAKLPVSGLSTEEFPVSKFGEDY